MRYCLAIMFFLSCFFSGCSRQPESVPEGYVYIPGGTFTMGCPADEAGAAPDEMVQRELYISPFYMKEHEVTFAEYMEYCNAAAGVEIPWDNGWGRGDRPVIHVNWYEAVAYCNWLSSLEGLEPVYDINGKEVSCKWKADGYRLPTEAEWEYACRAGTTTSYSTSEPFSTDLANYNGVLLSDSAEPGINRNMTLPVGSFPPNPWGLYDIHGNVWEWCWDCIALTTPVP